MQKWIEKYRPTTLNDIVGQDKIIQRLQEKVNNGGNISDLIFRGRAGTGKTTTAKALAHDLFGDNWKMAFSETNASNDRGIEIIRKKIIPSTKCMALIKVPFKIIFFDEADGITLEAQDCLRVPMEKTPNVRWILSCNNISKIIPEIKSRCTVYHFQPIDKADIVRRLQHIAEKESLTVDMKQLEMIAEVCGGDLRKAINDLQMNNTSGKEEDGIFNIYIRYLVWR